MPDPCGKVALILWAERSISHEEGETGRGGGRGELISQSPGRGSPESQGVALGGEGVLQGALNPVMVILGSPLDPPERGGTR